MSLSSYWWNIALNRSRLPWYEHKSSLRQIKGIDGNVYFVCPIPNCHARLLLADTRRTETVLVTNLVEMRCTFDHPVVVDISK